MFSNNLKTLNNASYVFDAKVFDYRLPFTIKDATFQRIYNRLIYKLELVSDLLVPFMTGSMIVEDVSNTIFGDKTSNEPKILNLIISSIKRSANGEEEIEATLDHSFLITNSRLVERKDDSAIYELTLISLDWYRFIGKVNYSTTTKETRFPSQILIDLLERSGLKHEEDSDYFSHNTKKIFYSTSANFTVLDNLKYILARCLEKEKGLYFIVSDHIKNLKRIVCLNTLYRVLANKSNQSYFSLYTKKNILLTPSKEVKAAGFSKVFAHDIKETSELNVHRALEMSQKNIFFDYDYLTRQFVRSEFPSNIVPEYLPSKSSTDFKSTYSEINDVIYEPLTNKIESPPGLDNKIAFYEKILKIFLYSDTIQFKCYGELERGAGQLYFLNIPFESLVKNKLHGFWFGVRVYHLFERDNYINTVQVCRLEKGLFNEPELQKTGVIG